MQTFDRDCKVTVEAADLPSSNNPTIIHVLHVDDDPSIQEITKLLLMDLKSNFDIDKAGCVDEALKKLSTGQYDAVISDYEMPQKNGLDFLKELRGQNNQIPFILLTGKGREDVAVKALNLGADRYINKNGSPETVYCELADAVTKAVEHKKSLENLRESGQRYRELANSLPNIVFEADLNGQVLFTNKMGIETSGYSHDDFEKGLNIMQFLAPEDRERATKNIELLLSGGNSFPIEYLFMRKNGTTFPVLVTTALNFCQNKVTGLRGLVVDITERKQAEQGLKESEEKYRKLFEESMDAIFLADIETGIIVDCNPAATKLVGRQKTELVGQHQSIITPKEQMDAEFARVFKQHLKDPTSTLETQIIRKTGEIRDVAVRDTIVELKEKRLMQGTLSDITERKKTEKSLKESEEKFRNLSEQSPNMIFINSHGKVSYANKKCEEILHYKREELYSPDFNFLSLIGSEYVEVLKSFYARHLKGEEVLPYECVLVTREGKKIDAILTSKLIEYNGEKAILGIATDISELKKAKEALHESEQKFHAVFSANPDAALFLDTSFHVVEANSRFSTLFGYSLDEIKGKIVTDFIVPDDPKEESKNLCQKIISGSAEIVTTQKRKNGSQIPLFMSRGPVLVNEKIVGYILVYKDISEIITVQEELTKTLENSELLNEKLRVVGSLTRHDIRNKLSTVAGYSYLMKKKHKDQADIVDGLDKIEQAVAASEKIFEFAKMYEQLGMEELSFVDVGKVVDEAAVLFSGLTIKVFNDCHGVVALADSFLRQMFYNFIDNTKKYGEKATIIKVHFEKAESGELMLVYEDDGVGVSVENKSNLFKEGFSTGGSTGFGLFLIRKMMDVYNWRIEENGRPGEGAKFIITIPKLNKNGKKNYQIAQ